VICPTFIQQCCPLPHIQPRKWSSSDPLGEPHRRSCGKSAVSKIDPRGVPSELAGWAALQEVARDAAPGFVSPAGRSPSPTGLDSMRRLVRTNEPDEELDEYLQLDPLGSRHRTTRHSLTLVTRLSTHDPRKEESMAPEPIDDKLTQEIYEPVRQWGLMALTSTSSISPLTASFRLQRNAVRLDASHRPQGRGEPCRPRQSW
jgi:hypothetical protein